MSLRRVLPVVALVAVLALFILVLARWGKPRGVAESRRELTAPANEIVTREGGRRWLSLQPAALPAAPFVVAGGPATAIWASAPGEEQKRLAALCAGADEVSLLGEAAGQVYWVERGGQSTRIRRQETGGGRTDTVVSESGRRSAALLEDRVAWTAPSQEAANQAQYCAVKTRPLAGEEVTVIADWLQPGATLLRDGGRLYAQEREVLWRLGERRGEQRALYRGSYGGRSPAMVGGVEYLVVGEKGKTRLVRRGVTWAGKLRVLVGR